MPFLSSILIYPIKSFDPILVNSARITAGGGLEHDREIAFFDSQGKYINGKRNPKVHLLKAMVDWKERCIFFRERQSGEEASFHISAQKAELEAWLSRYFETEVCLHVNSEGGFPDDKKAPGPTVIGESTLTEVAGWYDGIAIEEIRRRFRANLEISGCEPFWEDRLYDEAEQVVRFKVGDVQIEGTNPCQRCVVPTRDTKSGAIYPEFSNHFMQRRKETLPAWANQSRFNHYYRLAVNTCVPASEAGKVLRVGNEITIG